MSKFTKKQKIKLLIELRQRIEDDVMQNAFMCNQFENMAFDETGDYNGYGGLFQSIPELHKYRPVKHDEERINLAWYGGFEKKPRLEAIDNVIKELKAKKK